MVRFNKNRMVGCSAVAAAFMVWCFLPRLPEIATVDIAAITESFIKQEAKKHLSTQQKQKSIQTFSHQLEGALEELSKSKKHLILFPREAVLKGAKDYTHEVRHLMHLEA